MVGASKLPTSPLLLTRRIIACDSFDDGAGYYICQECDVINVLVWVEGKPSKGISFMSTDTLRAKAIQNRTSFLRDFSNIHRVMTHMYEAFLAQDDLAEDANDTP